ncbi:MAG: LysM peptidoglycan-binding domain-containing protein [bacterium]
MKVLKYLSLVFSLMLALSTGLLAQEEMTEEEWQNEINRLMDRKTSLTTELNALQNDVKNLKSLKAGMQSHEDCIKSLYALVDATKADVDKFRNLVNAVESKIDRREATKEDRQLELDALKISKISALPEFFDKVHNQLQRKMDAWEEKAKDISYTVVKGDCLWKIAGKKEHYANPFAWPKIYNANRDQIKNPDLIYPKQIFKIPNLTEEEKSKYDKLRKNFKPAPPQQTIGN